LRHTKFGHPKFEGSLNLDLYLEWIQSLERFFEIKQYYKEKAFKVVVLKLKSMLLFGMKNIQETKVQIWQVTN